MPKFLTVPEVERILTAIDVHVEMKTPGGHVRDGDVLWLKDLIIVAVNTGMRLSALSAGVTSTLRAAF